MAMNDKTKAIFNFLKNAPEDANYTADDISMALGINNTRSVNASITSAMTRHDPPLLKEFPHKLKWKMENGKTLRLSS